MRNKKTLLIIFFLSLFVFQQVQASANIQPNGKVSQINSAQENGLPTQIYIYMYHLDLENDGVAYEPHIDCEWLEQAEGCGEANTQHPYDTIPALVDIETKYLLDVLPREMDVATNNPPTLEALQAQAVAARSLADWKKRQNNGYINNSRDYQVFIPYAYEYYSPSNSGLIYDAVTSTAGQYLSYNGESIDAEFGADMKDRTITEPAEFPKDYLKGVEDPISNDVCGASDNSNRYGMSQLGAYRWSRGNQCAIGGDNNTKWPVTWTDYRQILAHYYTGIDILNGSGGKVAPDNRWNLLNYDLPNTTATTGTNFTVNVTLQNTSAANSNWSGVVIGYKWNSGNWMVLQPVSASLGNPPADLSLSIPVPIDLPTGATLHLDLGHQIDSQTIHWFSEQSPSWPDVQITGITVNGVVTLTPTFMPTLTPTPTFTATPMPLKSLEFVDWNLNLYTGVGGYQPCTTYPYISCSAAVTNTQTNPDRLDFDITYNYNDNWPIFGSDFYVDIRFKTNVFNTDVPIYWNVTGSAMPGRWIDTQYSGTVDYGDRNNPIAEIGKWIIPGQPSPYDKSTFHFLRTTSALETLIQTDSWHLTLATYNINCWISKKIHEDSYNPTMIQTANLLYRLRDEKLNAAGRQHYITLYYTHSAEIANIMDAHSELATQGLDVINTLSPNLQALLNGQGSTVTITSLQVQQSQAFLDALLPYASLDLKQAIANERARHPLENMISRSRKRKIRMAQNDIGKAV